MKKFILFFVLLILTLAFAAFLVNAYLLQKNYFDTKDINTLTENETQNVEVTEKKSFYNDYLKSDYDSAIKDHNVLVLYFTSNWCKECTDQDLLNVEVFSELNTPGVVGQRIHILDSESTTETAALAKKYDVVKEQSFVVVDKNGASYFKYTGKLSKEILNQKIMEVTK